MGFREAADGVAEAASQWLAGESPACWVPDLVQGDRVGALVQGLALERDGFAIGDDDGHDLSAADLGQPVEGGEDGIRIVERPVLGGAVLVPDPGQAVAQRQRTPPPGRWRPALPSFRDYSQRNVVADNVVANCDL